MLQFLESGVIRDILISEFNLQQRYEIDDDDPHKVDNLYKQYEEQLKTARVDAQSVIAQSEKEAKDAVAAEIGEARADAARLIDKTNKECEYCPLKQLLRLLR